MFGGCHVNNHYSKMFNDHKSPSRFLGVSELSDQINARPENKPRTQLPFKQKH